MARSFADIAFTAKVKALQSRMGSREAYARREQGPVENAVLGPQETDFIEARDTFYLGTVSETGWPYVQHRGGPAGFLKALDARTIGFADFAGNRQYVSAGNLAGDDRVSLILMDYPQQLRLKILGRARVIDETGDPGLLERLDNPHYRARVERGIVIRIEGFDWNCPKYITPRYTNDQIAARNRETSSLPAAQLDARPEDAIGSGEIALTITGVRQLTPRIRAYELRAGDWSDLPPAEAGAHLELPVRLADATVVTRQYSLVTDPGRRDSYRIAVLLESEGRGGSRAIHENWQIGTRLRVAPPVNHFPLHTDLRPAVLIAGGIGITPIKSMALALKQRKVPLELHYVGRSAVNMAYRERLAIEFPSGFHSYFSRVPGQPRFDVAEVMQRAAADTVFYVCGPQTLIEAVRSTAIRLGIAPERVQQESFY